MNRSVTSLRSHLAVCLALGLLVWSVARVSAQPLTRDAKDQFLRMAEVVDATRVGSGTTLPCGLR